MIELQPVIIQSDGDYVRCSLGELYLKEEVDHYISELIADQQLELDEWYCKVEHQKYKRCLAMADYCFARSVAEDVLHTNRDGIEHSDYWLCRHNRWMELAEIYKAVKG